MELWQIKEIYSVFLALQNKENPVALLQRIGHANMFQIGHVCGSFFRLQQYEDEINHHLPAKDLFPLFAHWRDKNHFKKNTSLYVISHTENPSEFDLELLPAELLNDQNGKLLICCDVSPHSSKIFELDWTSPFLLTCLEANYFEANPEDLKLWAKCARMMCTKERVAYIIRMATLRADTPRILIELQNKYEKGRVDSWNFCCFSIP